MALKKYQYNRILREYDDIRFQNKYELDNRIKEAFEAIPKLKELEDKLISLSAQSGRLALFGNTKALDELKENTASIREQQRQLLLDHGYPEDYLQMQYKCIKCKDTGFIDNE